MKGITVIIPTYNREKLISEAINSVLDQNYSGNIEIIISDDGSGNNTLQVLSSFGSQINILHKPVDCRSQGASGARNRGILEATQEYICFLDSDDFFLPGHLGNMVGALESDPSLGFAVCNSLVMLEVKGRKKYRRWTKEKVIPKDVRNLTITTPFLASTNAFIFKKEVFDKVGLFDENLEVGEDTDMWMRINENFNGVYSNHYGCVIRMHNMPRLTDVTNKSFLEIHYFIYRNAIRRYHSQNVNDPYRLWSLWLLTLKYSVSQWPLMNNFYKYMKERGKKENNSTSEISSFRPLEFFLNHNKNKEELERIIQ